LLVEREQDKEILLNQGSKQSQITMQTSDNEPNEVSYTALNNTGDVATILQKIATAINVRLTLDATDTFPFVSFDKFESIVKADKVFLYGISGSGKSRGIFEIIAHELHNFERIYIINPRNAIGEESGRIPIAEIASQWNEKDAIIWDNFPDDLIKRDARNAIKVLGALSLNDMGKLLVALKPKYLEIFRDSLSDLMPEFYLCEISYEREKIKKLVRAYGSEIAQFKEIYDLFVSKDLERVSKALWQKEPTPLTVFDYFNELKNKSAKQHPIDTVETREATTTSTTSSAQKNSNISRKNSSSSLSIDPFFWQKI
jgi:hypothetical protein